MASAPTIHKRLLLLAALPALAFAGPAGAVPERVSSVRLDVPTRAVQGNYVSASVRVSPAGARCSLSVQYDSGAKQHGLGTRAARGGRASWRWLVARGTKPGPAMAMVSCGAAGGAVKTIMVVGSVIPAHISVVKQGYTQRAFQYGGSTVSWGVILANDSPQDAQDVTVLANFVMPDNRLIGSTTTHVSAVAAGRQHALGGDLSFPGVPPIARLEIVVTIGKSGPATKAFPAVANTRVVMDPYDVGWTGSVEGEIQNDQAARTLQSVELSCVIFDAAGNVLGGGTGFTFAALPPGAREFYKISNGLRAIPFANAASAEVSIVPTYQS